jgi:hypothetical protein
MKMTKEAKEKQKKKQPQEKSVLVQKAELNIEEKKVEQEHQLYYPVK